MSKMNQSSAKTTSYSNDLQKAINGQINNEICASHEYFQLAWSCARDENALHGFKEFFLNFAHQRFCDAMCLSSYQTVRGGHVEVSETRAPKLNWKGAEETFKKLLELEKGISDDLNKLDDTADKTGDRAAANFIENKLLAKQTCRVKIIADMLTQIKRVSGEGTGLFQLDLVLKKNCGIPPWDERHDDYRREHGHGREHEREHERIAAFHERFAANLNLKN
ncbi:hypothetical protein Glove_74g116 [Diversispora epigaea]|uniref:Ferritin n=1 Tax=Diversispora epigaea TaxID=1348612 RepID=A0A397JFY4_9GLOM|nr:hypothetical protein Glove_74g116 [Diversispora epigaea]